jgi:hypothetical protein
VERPAGESINDGHLSFAIELFRFDLPAVTRRAAAYVPASPFGFQMHICCSVPVSIYSS